MNWLGWSTRAFIGALLGALLGGLAYHEALARSFDVPWIVGLLVGLGAFFSAPDRSGLRGLMIATFAIWVAWAVQVRFEPFADAGLLGFHETLGPRRLAAFIACGAAAFLFARTSIRPSAGRRIAGT